MSRTDHGTLIECVGEMDVGGASRFKNSVDLVLEDERQALKIDASGVTLLASAGIRALLNTLELCRALGVRFDLKLQGHPRRVLDVVGLWWLGVIDDGSEIESHLNDAMARYSDLYDDYGLGGGVGHGSRGHEPLEPDH